MLKIEKVVVKIVSKYCIDESEMYNVFGLGSPVIVLDLPSLVRVHNFNCIACAHL